MTTFTRAHLLLAALLPIVSSLVACHSEGHAATASQPPKVAVCKSCYDQIIRARASYRRGEMPTRAVHKHMCPDCASELTLRDEAGVLTAHCARCAPEGVACDLCIPRTATR